jgi:hypothetical protein
MQMTAAAQDPGSQQLLVIGDQPIVLAGAPPRCVGFIAMKNPTATAQRVKGMILRSDADALFETGCRDSGPILLLSSKATTVPGEPPGGEPPSGACEPPSRELRLRAFGRLAPCSCGDINVELPLHPATTPGIYPATIEYPKGTIAPATVHVFERRHTRLHPSTIPFTVQPGQKLVVAVTAKNLGNVETTIAHGVVVMLRAGDENWHQHLHRAASATGDQGHGPVLDEFVKRMGESELRPSRAKVSVGAGALAPMESRTLQVEFTVPAGLAKGRRYIAVSKLGDGQLTFLLQTPNGIDASNDGEEAQ